MAFCTACGQQIGDDDIFCAHCGARQPARENTPPPSAKPSNTMSSVDELMSPRTASVLAYAPFLGWVACIIILASERYRGMRNVRFHAFQALFLFVVWLLLDYVVDDILRAMRMRSVANLLKLSTLGVQIYMMVMTAQEKLIRLPVLGEFAEKTLDEQGG
jgi:uncharacterized membrane protein